MGAWFLSEGEGFAAVMLVFGGIAAVTAVQDVRLFRSDDAEPRWWFFEHLTRMIAAYIATVTAFAAVNATFLPVLARWLLPTAVGGVGIWYLRRRYHAQFGTSARVADAPRRW